MTAPSLLTRASLTHARDRARGRRFDRAAPGRLRARPRRSRPPRAASDGSGDRGASLDAQDWRAFRAALVAAHRGNEALAVSAKAREGRWAHGLEAAERGALLVAVDEDARSFWSHVVILMLGAVSSIRL